MSHLEKTASSTVEQKGGSFVPEPWTGRRKEGLVTHVKDLNTFQLKEGTGNLQQHLTCCDLHIYIISLALWMVWGQEKYLEYLSNTSES